MHNMTLIPIDDFLPDIEPELMRCPIPVIERRLRDSIIESCERANLWRWEHPEIPVTRDQRVYDLTGPTDETLIHSILSVKHEERPLYNILDRDTECNPYTEFYQYGGGGYVIRDRGQIELTSDPRRDSVLLNLGPAPMECDPEVIVPPFPSDPDLLDAYYEALYASWLRDSACDGTLPDPPVAPGPAPVVVPHEVSFVESGTKTITHSANSHLVSTLSGNAMKNRGQWYWEMVIDIFDTSTAIGITQMGIASPNSRAGSNFLGRLRFEFGLFADGNWREFNQIEDTQTGYVQGDVVGFKMDLDTRTLEYNINGGPFIALSDSTNATQGVFAFGTWVPSANVFGNGQITVRTDADEFTGPVPAGYLPIGTPGGLDSYDGVFDMQRSDTDVPPFGEEGYLPIATDPDGDGVALRGLYQFNNIPGPAPDWVLTDDARFASSAFALGNTAQRANSIIRNLASARLRFDSPELQAGSTFVSVTSGFGTYQETTADYVADFQTETPVPQDEIDAHAAAVARFALDQAAFDAAVAVQNIPDPNPPPLVPEEGRVRGLEICVTIKPTRNCMEVSDVLYKDYHKLIVTGTLAKALAMKDQPWSDLELSAAYAREYEYDLAKARSMIDRGFTTKTQRIISRSFV